MSIAETPELLEAARAGDNEACARILEENAGLHFVVRVDLATPIRKPHLPESERWGNTFDLKDKSWRRENLVFNFAIGYPF